ncbi:MAG: hypothetical protein SPE73_08890 [Prevotella sp.]|nr:hypothetical protein [Prevotella sp.]MCI6555553.1 hypothetical protein [Prevotella sp.]MCI7688095.1 hypothetical protein [Prevotella sp.]MDD6671048.1 hypothetical protein [Prevotella sp.]MDD6753123.1 hypothetical protein [Prevotella sp.]
MNIINRNFFRILRAGALDENEPLEPMSEFKWNRLFQMIKSQNVSAIALEGIQARRDDENNNIPSELVAELQASVYEAPKTKTQHAHSFEVPSLSNPILDHKLKKIFNNERHSIDTNIDSLRLLGIIIDNVQTILNKGMSLGGVLELGKFLRTRGDKVDFVKIDNWLQALHMRRMAQLQGSILILVFNFEQDEIPFVNNIEPSAGKIILRTVTNLATDTAEEWHFRQGRSGFVRNNSAVLRRNLRRSLRYIAYAPIETTSNFVSNFARSLSEIEE